MNKLLIAVSLLALCSTPALAADDGMTAFFGNTIISTGGMAEIHTHYRADHTFDIAGSMMGLSGTFKGTWALDGKGDVCRTYVGGTPPNVTNPQCVPFTSHKVGDVWKSKDNSRALTLVSGNQ